MRMIPFFGDGGGEEGKKREGENPLSERRQVLSNVSCIVAH